MAEIKIIENPSEIGAGTRGASLGIGALKVVAHNKQSGFFGKYERFHVQDENELLNENPVFKYAKRIDGIVNVYQRTADIVAHVLEQGNFPLVLAGDHSSAGGTIAGIKQQYPNKRLGVIWIDAHADLHTPYTTPSGNTHGMPLATALGTDNKECQVNDPSPEAKEYWEKLKNIGGFVGKVQPSDIVFVGVRDTEDPEDKLMEREGIKNFTVAEVREMGVDQLVEAIKSKLQDCDMVYVSFDVDSMDCELISLGTGTPVKDGLTDAEANALMCQLAAWRKVNCIEMVEINPCLDNKINFMAETAYDVLENFTEHLEKRL